MNTKFATHSGILIDYTKFDKRRITLEDIAHHLTQIGRFGGSLPLGMRYSVASHSMNCFKMAKELGYSKVIMKACLLHDATEAFLGDVVSGLKAIIPEYAKIESRLDEVIRNKFDVLNYDSIAQYVNEIDKRIFMDEVLCLIPEKFDLYYKHANHDPYGIDWIREDKYPGLIKQLFLHTCNEVGIHD